MRYVDVAWPRYEKMKQVDGVFFVEDTYGNYSNSIGCLPDVLQYVHQRTGMYTVALVKGGVGMNTAKEFLEAFSNLHVLPEMKSMPSPKTVKFMVFILKEGNVYDKPYDSRLCHAFGKVLLDAKQYADNVHLVFGGKTSLRGGQFRQVCDEKVKKVIKTLKEYAESIKGDKVWQDLETNHGIHRADDASYEAVARGFAFLAVWASGTVPHKSRLR